MVCSVRRTVRAGLAIGVAVLLAGSAVTASGAQTIEPAPGDLPPVSFSSRTWHEGDRVSVSGTGCDDPKTHSSVGLEVVVYRTISAGRGGSTPLKTITASVSADGRFHGTATIEQPLAPEGVQDVFVVCDKAADQPYPGPGLRARTEKATIVAPPLPDLTVAAGSTFPYQLPCSIAGGEYGSFYFQLEGRELGFGVPGKFPYDQSPKAGDVVEITAPSDVAPGTYPASAQCSISESGLQAFYNHFSITITPAGTPNTTTQPRPVPSTEPSSTSTVPASSTTPNSSSAPPAPAPGAVAMPGSPSYTG